MLNISLYMASKYSSRHRKKCYLLIKFYSTPFLILMKFNVYVSYFGK